MLEVDVDRKRISFTMRLDDTPAPQSKGPKGSGKPQNKGGSNRNQKGQQGRQSAPANAAMGNAFADAFAKAKKN